MIRDTLRKYSIVGSFLFFLLFGGIVESPSVSSALATIQGHQQAVCNASPNKQGEYTEEGCKAAFNSVPTAALKCFSWERVVLKSCTVNNGPKNQCTNNEKKTGQWCTCTYACEFKKND